MRKRRQMRQMRAFGAFLKIDNTAKYKPGGFSNTASAKESVARSSSTSAISGSSRPLANDSIPSFFEDPSPPPEFHKYILPKVLSLINMIDPSALSSQASLWNFLLDSTRVQNASEARNVLNSLSMNPARTSDIHSYFEQLQAVTLRCRTFIPHSSPKALISAFIKGIKPSTLRNALFDEFNLNLLNSLEDLVSRTIILHKNLFFPHAVPQEYLFPFCAPLFLFARISKNLSSSYTTSFPFTSPF
ncbi:hypothetical protein GEMRC1_009116 [Eukaryota sp. GEM-RC1]